MNTFLRDEFHNGMSIVAFKIISDKYIKSVLSEGILGFSCADKYTYEQMKTGNKGKGDKDEGLFARVRKCHKEFVASMKNKYGNDLIIIENGNFFDFKLKSVVNIPTFCLYSLDLATPGIYIQDIPACAPYSNGWYTRTYKFQVNERLHSVIFGIGYFIGFNYLFI